VIIEPVIKHETITPSDTTALEKYSAIIVVSGGDVAIEDRYGTQITYAACPAFTTFSNFMPAKILATGTTATQIVGWRYEGDG